MSSRSMRCLLSIMSLAILSAGSAKAETSLRQIDGTVLVNKGLGYKPASGATPLAPGDRILITGKSSANLNYGRSCSIPVRSGLYTISKTSPCKVKAADLPVRTEPLAPEPVIVQPTSSGFDLGTAALIGGAGLALGVGIYLFNKNDGKTFVSP